MAEGLQAQLARRSSASIFCFAFPDRSAARPSGGGMMDGRKWNGSSGGSDSAPLPSAVFDWKPRRVSSMRLSCPALGVRAFPAAAPEKIPRQHKRVENPDALNFSFSPAHGCLPSASCESSRRHHRHQSCPSLSLPCEAPTPAHSSQVYFGSRASLRTRQGIHYRRARLPTLHLQKQRYVHSPSIRAWHSMLP